MGSAITIPQSSIARGFLAQFYAARQADESRSFASLSAVEDALENQRDQLPLLVPVGLGAGIVCWQLGGENNWPVIVSSVSGFLFIAAYLGVQFRLARMLFWAVMLFCLGFGAIAVKSRIVMSDRLEKPSISTINARVESVEDISARGKVRYVLFTDGANGLPALVRVNVPLENHLDAISPGSIIQVKARLMPPAGPALPGGYDFARQAWFLGIGATGSALTPPIVITPSPGGANFWGALREKLAADIRTAMPDGTGAVGAALLVGTRGAISQADAEALRNSGMAHLLSVSGLHVTAVVGGAFLMISRILALFPWLALRIRIPIAAAGGAAVIAVCYTLLTGMEVPTIRACIASLLILVALAFGREPLSLRLLAAGACLVLLFWPEALAGPSFQLSFAAVATIIVLHESPSVRKWTLNRDEPVIFRLSRVIVSLLLTGLAIELVLSPIALFHFHKSGLYGAAANIIAIPLTTFFVMPLQMLALLADYLGVGGIFWWLAGQGVAVIIALAHSVSDAPGSVMLLPSMPRWAFGLTVIGGLWLAIFRDRLRLWGVVPLIAGAFAIACAPRPDVLITGDGRHVAVVDQESAMVLLRAQVGDYALSMLSENAAIKAEPIAMDQWKGAKCSPDICIFTITSAKREWSVLATRTSYLVPSMELAAACKRVDIAISERYLPWSCKPRWMKVDRAFLEQHGGLAIHFTSGRIESVAQTNAHLPWSNLGKTERAPKRPFVQHSKPKDQ